MLLKDRQNNKLANKRANVSKKHNLFLGVVIIIKKKRDARVLHVIAPECLTIVVLGSRLSTFSAMHSSECSREWISQ